MLGVSAYGFGGALRFRFGALVGPQKARKQTLEAK